MKMQDLKLLAHRFAGRTILTTLAATSVFAAAAIASPTAVRTGPETVHPVQLRMNTAPQPGDCRAAFVSAIGPNPATAIAIWQATVNQSLGSNWAIWVGAQNKQVVPQAATQFVATAQPCFHYPVQ